MSQTQANAVKARVFVVMEESDWGEKFKPIANLLVENASFEGWNPEFPEAGCMFETYGIELQYVKDVCAGKVPGLSSLNVWTLMDGDEPDEDSPEGVKLKASGWEYVDGEGWQKNGGNLDTTFIGDGFHFVNRIGYFVTGVPADENTDYNILGEDLAEAST